MNADEQQIRELVKRWMAASKVGDVNEMLSLMTDDIVFLLPGRLPMTKAEFAALSVSSAQTPPPLVESVSEIQEIKVLGDWAFMWTKLRLSVLLERTSRPSIRAGFTLSILQKQDGKWLLARDANLLSPVAPGTDEQNA